jgi:hypothetical protein
MTGVSTTANAFPEMPMKLQNGIYFDNVQNLGKGKKFETINFCTELG